MEFLIIRAFITLCLEEIIETPEGPSWRGFTTRYVEGLIPLSQIPEGTELAQGQLVRGVMDGKMAGADGHRFVLS